MVFRAKITCQTAFFLIISDVTVSSGRGLKEKEVLNVRKMDHSDRCRDKSPA
jgi:hypothetical protein